MYSVHWAGEMAVKVSDVFKYIPVFKCEFSMSKRSITALDFEGRVLVMVRVLILVALVQVRVLTLVVLLPVRVVDVF